MRTPISIDEQRAAKAKAGAAASGRTPGAVVEDALRQAFARRTRVTADARPPLPACCANRPAPGSDLDDSSALLDRLERAEP